MPFFKRNTSRPLSPLTPEQREERKAFGYAVGIHVLLFVFMLVGFVSNPTTPQPVQVELWTDGVSPNAQPEEPIEEEETATEPEPRPEPEPVTEPEPAPEPEPEPEPESAVKTKHKKDATKTEISEPPKQNQNKKNEKPSGVIASIYEFICNGPIGKSEILEKLKDRFPDRDIDKMKKTLNVQIGSSSPCRMEREKKVTFKIDKEGKRSIKK